MFYPGKMEDVLKLVFTNLSYLSLIRVGRVCVLYHKLSVFTLISYTPTLTDLKDIFGIKILMKAVVDGIFRYDTRYIEGKNIVFIPKAIGISYYKIPFSFSRGMVALLDISENPEGILRSLEASNLVIGLRPYKAPPILYNLGEKDCLSSEKIQKALKYGIEHIRELQLFSEKTYRRLTLTKNFLPKFEN